MEDQKIKIAKKIFDGINSGDFSGVVASFDSNAERIEFEELPNCIRLKGLSEILPHFEQARNSWAEGACMPEKFFQYGEILVVSVHVRVRQNNKTEWIDAKIGDTFTFRNEKVIEMRSFLTLQAAQDWAASAR